MSIPAVSQQDVDHTVKLHGDTLETKIGWTWCVDPGCSMLATNYHTAKEGLPDNIGGAKVLEVYFATGPDDSGAIWMMSTSGKWLRYNPINDVALILLSKPLLPGTPAPSFYGGALAPGQELVVNGSTSTDKQPPVAATFAGIGNGLLELSISAEAPTGVSDGVVADKQGRIIGMLSSVTNRSAIAVPLRSIADAIRKFRPNLYSQLFPDGFHKVPEFQDSTAISREVLAAVSGVSPAAALPLSYLEDGLGQPFPGLAAHPLRLRRSREDPPDIVELRRRAKRMVQEMANFRALQTLRLNSEGQPELVWVHELYVDSGRLVFRAVDGGEVMQALPIPRQLALLPGAEWRELPRMVGSELKLRVEEVNSKTIAGKPFRVFRYQASAEDQVCWVNFHREAPQITFQGRRRIRTIASHDQQFPVACRGEVWADAELNPLRVTRELEIPPGKAPMQHVQLAVLYGWIGNDLVPVEMTIRGTVSGHPCRSDVHFSNYRLGSH